MAAPVSCPDSPASRSLARTSSASGCGSRSYDHRVTPGRPGGLPVALGQQGVAEPAQRVPLAERRTDLAIGLDGLGVVRLGLGDVPQVQVDVADAVQGVGGAAAVPGVAVQAQRPLAVGQRPVVLAQVGVQPADPVLQGGLLPPVPDGLEHPQCVQRDGQRLGVAFLFLQHACQAVEHHGLVGPVAELAELIERSPEVRVGVGVRAGLRLDASEQVVRVGQGERVVQPGSRGQRDLLGRGVVLLTAAPVEERAERPGDLPGVGVEVAGVGEGDQREQHRDLGVEPGHRLVFVGHVGGQHARLRPGQLQRRPERAEPVRGCHRGVQVVVQHPVRRGLALGLRVVLFGLVGRVRTEQVVEREPGRQVLGHHVGPGQLAQRGARGGPRHPGQAGRRRQRDVRARVHAEQAEQPRRGLGELVVGPGEHGPHVGHRVAGLERRRACPARRAVRRRARSAGAWAAPPPGRPHAQGQREAGAGGDDLVRGPGFGRDAGPAEPAGEHLVRLDVAEHAEGERNRAFGRDKTGQLVAGGHHDQ